MENNIHNWKRENGLTRKSLYIPMLEAYRRYHMFGNSVILATPSEVKDVKNAGYFTSVGFEIPRVNNWYQLTTKGHLVLNKLIKTLVWNEKEMNQYLFNL